MTENKYSFTSFLDFINNNFVGLLVGVLVLAGGFFVGSLWTENQLLKSGGLTSTGSGTTGTDAAAPAAPTGPTAEQLASLPAVSEEDWQRGSANPKVWLVEYSDFECPFCQRFHPTTQQVLDEYGDDVALVYRHFPLSFHPNAQRAAEASECIGQLGGDEAFWAYADAVFDENSKLGGRLSEEAIDTAIQATGVNGDAVASCLDGGEMADKVATQTSEGSAAGVTGTPGTFVVTADGVQELIPGALPYDQVAAIIDKYL